MTQENESENIGLIVSLLVDAGLVERRPGAAVNDLKVHPLTGDGSSRRFWRVSHHGRPLCLAVAPAGTTVVEMREAQAARHIGLHLYQNGVRVPAQYGWDQDRGMLLFEDLGDVKLHDLVERSHIDLGGIEIERVRRLYAQAMEQLALMQVRGGQGFEPDWCWDTPVYDQQVMLERESGYFLRACWEDLLGQESPAGINEEFAWIARGASLAEATFFLHRDCQSRNIMVRNGQVCFIDFQGGRLGPLGYDPASLLIDPYVVLPQSWQEDLLDVYLSVLRTLHPVDERQFRREYSYLALQRNLQIIGAFSFLSRVRGKVFFARFIIPALESLVVRLSDPVLHDLHVLGGMASRALALLRHRG